jgi:hypothetical protein
VWWLNKVTRCAVGRTFLQPMSSEGAQAFIARSAAVGASERVNSQPFLCALCNLPGAARPEPTRENGSGLELEGAGHRPVGSISTRLQFGECRRKDPRTPRQLHWRARFAAASRTYSESMTEQQRGACIAAGAKLRSRPRLSQSGPLTGQQYSIRREYAAKEWEGERPREPKLKTDTLSAEKRTKGLQTQAISRSTSGPHRGIAGVPLEQYRRHTGRVFKNEGSGKGKEGSRLKARSASEVPKAKRFTRPAGVPFRRVPRGVPSQLTSKWGRFPGSRRVNVRASPPVTHSAKPP